MNIVSVAAGQIFTMAVIILIAWICYKVKLIGKEGGDVLSDILIYLINPCIIFCSYQVEFNIKLVTGLLISFVLAVFSHLLSIVAAWIFIRDKKADIINERMGVIYTNCGFLAIPLVNEIYGLEGVFYLTAYITVFNILIWTHGVLYIGGSDCKSEVLKAFRSPAVLSVIAGLLFYFARIRLPELVIRPLQTIGSMNTPIAMMIAGICIAQTDIRKTLFKTRLYLVSALKLIVIPILFILICRPFYGEGIVTGVSVIATASPTATMCMIFAVKYGKDAGYASEIFAVTTILSMITIPFVLFFLHWIPI